MSKTAPDVMNAYVYQCRDYGNQKGDLKLVKMEIIATGATTEEAIENGCRELGLQRDEVSFEVLELPKTKTLGLFGGSPASVRVYVESNQGETAAEYLRTIIDAMGLQGIEIEIIPNEDGSGAMLDLKGDMLGAVIGRRGETLSALQYLVSLAANNSGEEYYRVTINIGNYREKREGSLDNLAKKTALRSIKIGKNLALDPMNPYERRIVHTAVQSVDGATSWSVGEGAKRHVVIGPEGVDEGSEGLPVNHSRSSFGNNKSSFGGNRGGNYGSHGSYGNRGGYGNRNYNRSEGDGSSYGNRSYNRSEGDGSSYGNRGGYGNHSYNRSEGDGSSYGNRGGYGNRSYNRSEGDGSSYGNRGGYGNRSNYSRGGGSGSSYGNRGGYNKGGYSNRSNNDSSQTAEPREKKRDTTAPLYGRIEIPKKKDDGNSEE